MSVVLRSLTEGIISLRKALYRSKVLLQALHLVGDDIYASSDIREGRRLRRALLTLKEAGYLRMVWTGPHTVKFLPTEKLINELKQIGPPLEPLYERLKSIYEEAQDEDRNDKGNIH